MHKRSDLIGKKQTDLKGITQFEVSKIEARKDLKISTLKKHAEALGMKVKLVWSQKMMIKVSRFQFTGK